MFACLLTHDGGVSASNAMVPVFAVFEMFANVMLR